MCRDSGNMLTRTVMSTFLHLQVEDEISRTFTVFFRPRYGVRNLTQSFCFFLFNQCDINSDLYMRSYILKVRKVFYEEQSRTRNEDHLNLCRSTRKVVVDGKCISASWKTVRKMGGELLERVPGC